MRRTFGIIGAFALVSALPGLYMMACTVWGGRPLNIYEQLIATFAVLGGYLGCVNNVASALRKK